MIRRSSLSGVHFLLSPALAWQAGAWKPTQVLPPRPGSPTWQMAIQRVRYQPLIATSFAVLSGHPSSKRKFLKIDGGITPCIWFATSPAKTRPSHNCWIGLSASRRPASRRAWRCTKPKRQGLRNLFPCGCLLVMGRDTPDASNSDNPYNLEEFAAKHGLWLTAAQAVLHTNGPSKVACDAAAEAFLAALATRVRRESVDSIARKSPPLFRR